jgi:hypothetical protein
LAAPVSTGHVWVSWLHNRVSSNWSTGFNIRTAGGGSWLTIDYKGGTDSNWALTQNAGVRTEIVSGDIRPAVNYFVAQLDFDADLIRLWMNPDVAGTTPSNSAGYIEVPMTDAANRSLGRFLLSGYSNSGQTVFDEIDEIRVASSFEQLYFGTTVTRNVTVSDDEDVAIPNPGTIEFTAPVFSTTEPVYTGTTQSQTKTVTVTARRTGGNEGIVSVDYAAAGIESVSFAGENYNTGVTGSISREFQSNRPHVADGTGTLTWTDGDMTEKTITFTINADTTYTTATGTTAANNLVEGTESLELFLARPKGGATLGTNARARFDILDAQAPAGGQGVIQLARPRFSAFEDAGSMPVVLSRTQGSTGAVSATLTTSSSLPSGYGGFTNPITAAVAGADYTTVSQVVTWADGDTADKIVNIPLNDNGAVQSATDSRGVRGIRFQLSTPTGGALTSINEALGLILDDESETFDVWVENLYGKRMSIRLPRNTPTVRGLIHFMPGTGGDWRYQVNSASHQAVADQWGFAISGQLANAFATTTPSGVVEFHNQLDALALFSGRPELRNAPVVFTGISAGGFACTDTHGSVPEQILGFVAHKGGSYEFNKGISQYDTKPYIHESNLFTPGLIIAGSNDGTVEAQDLYDPFLLYRQNLAPGSQMTTAVDWNVGHSDTGGQGWAMAYLFMDDLIRLRYPDGQVPGTDFGDIVPLTNIPHANTWLVQQVDDFLGNRRPDPAAASANLQIRPAAGVADPGTDGIVLSERLAQAYQAFSSLHGSSYQGSVPYQSPLEITSHTTDHTQITGIDLGQSTTVTLDPRGYANFNRADFYFNNELVGTRSAAPWSFTFTPDESGVALLRVETSTSGGGEIRYAFETLLVRDIPPYAPATPTGLTVTRPTGTSAALSWDLSPFTSTLLVQRSATGASGTWTTIATIDGTDTSYNDSTLIDGASYWYRLVASNPYGDSPATTSEILLVESTALLVNDPFSDNDVTNGADPLDVAWSKTGNTFAVVTDTTLDPDASNRVAEFSISTSNKDEYLSFPLPSAVSLAVDEGLRVSFKLRHTGTPRPDVSATGVSLAYTLNASSSPWNNVNNREYFMLTSYGNATPQGMIRKTGTGGAQLLNSGTQTLATGLASINAGTNVTNVSLEVFRLGESAVRISYRLNGGPEQSFTDTSDVVTAFNRVFLRFRTRTDAAAPAFRLDDVMVHRLTPTLETDLAEPVQSLYSESFDNNTGGNTTVDVSAPGWQIHFSETGARVTNPGYSAGQPTAGVSNTLSHPDSPDAGTNGVAYMYYGVTNSTRAFLLWRELPQGLQTSESLTFDWWNLHQNAGAESRLAVRIDGQWYLHRTPFTSAQTGGTSEFSAKASAANIDFTFDATDWSIFAFSPGSAFALTNSPAALGSALPSGVISAFGLYNYTVSGAAINGASVDAFTITGPASAIVTPPEASESVTQNFENDAALADAFRANEGGMSRLASAGLSSSDALATTGNPQLLYRPDTFSGAAENALGVYVKISEQANSGYDSVTAMLGLATKPTMSFQGTASDPNVFVASRILNLSNNAGYRLEILNKTATDAAQSTVASGTTFALTDDAWYYVRQGLSPTGGDSFSLKIEIYAADAAGTIGSLVTSLTETLTNAEIAADSRLWAMLRSRSDGNAAAMDDFAVSTATAAPAPIRTFVMSGQSNTVGYRANDRYALPLSLRGSISGVHSAWFLGNKNGDTLVPYTSSGWNLLEVQNVGTTSGPFWPNAEGFGPEITLADRLHSHYGEDIAMIKFAVNGASLAVNFNPANAGTSGYYDELRDYLRQRRTELENSLDQELDWQGFFWLQGESDASANSPQPASADAYAANLAGFVTQLRTDLETPALFFVASQINPRTATFPPENVAKINNALLAASADPLFRLAPAVDLMPAGGDNLHFNSPQVMEIGERLADAYLKTPAAVSLSNLTQTVDGNGKSPTATTTPAGLTVIHRFDGSAILPTTSNHYEVLVRIDDPDNAGFAFGTFTLLTAEGIVDSTGNGADDDWELDIFGDLIDSPVDINGRSCTRREIFVWALPDPLNQVFRIQDWGFTTSANRFYDVYYSDDLTDPEAWLPLSGQQNLSASAGTLLQIQDPSPANVRAYRVRVRLPLP